MTCAALRRIQRLLVFVQQISGEIPHLKKCNVDMKAHKRDCLQETVGPKT